MPSKVEAWCEKWGKKEDGYATVDFAGTRFVLVFDEKSCAELMQWLRSIGANGLFAASGEVWKQERKIWGAALNHASVVDYMTIMRRCVEGLVKKWSNDDGVTVDVNRDTYNVAADTITQVSMDKDFDFLNKESTFGEDIKRICGLTVMRSFSPIQYWRIPFVGQYIFDGAGHSIDRVSCFLQAEMRAQAKQYNTSSTSGDVRPNFVQRCLKHIHNEKTDYDPTRLAGNVLTLIIGGIDTTGATLANALWYLAKSSDLQSRLRREVSKVDGATSVKDLINLLPRTKSFIHEIHRHYGLPAAPMKSHMDIPFSGGKLPKGTNILLMDRLISASKTAPLSSVPRGPKGSLPHEFCPERYLVVDQNGNVTCPHPPSDAAFGAFGVGVRSCPGRLYAEALSLLALARILQELQVELALNRDPVFNWNIVMTPQNGVHLKFHPIKGN